MNKYSILPLSIIILYNSTFALRTQKVRDVIENFGFLVPGNKISVSGQQKIETVDVLIICNMTDLEFRTIKIQLDTIIENFQKLAIFNDVPLKTEYTSFLKNPVQNYNSFMRNIEQILTFKGVQSCKQTASCQEIIFKFELKDLTVVKNNLLYRYNQVDTSTWTAQTVKDKREQQNTLLSFISTLDTFFTEMEFKTQKVISAIEALSNRDFPDEILADLPGVCNDSTLYMGEKHEVVSCQGCDTGYTCNIIVETPSNILEMTRMLPVAYRNVHLEGFEPHYIFAKTSEQELKQLDCEAPQFSDYIPCQIMELESNCKNGLDTNNIIHSIQYCTFSYSDLPVSELLPGGGVLVQDLLAERIQINNGDSIVDKRPPFLLYSPKEVTVQWGDEEFVYGKAINISEAKLIQSILTEENVSYLVSTLKWKTFWSKFSTADYIRYILIATQLTLLPIALYTFICTIKNNKKIKVVNQSKKNYKANKEYLLKRVK